MRSLTSCAAICLALLLAEVSEAAKVYSLPKEFLKCKRNDNVCLKTAIQKALPAMTKGLPKLGILPIDPLRVTEMFIDQGEGPVSLKLTLKNQDLYGISSSIVNKVVSDMTDQTYRLAVDVTIPTFILRGDYVVDGRVLVLPLRGAGKDNLTLTDLTANLVTVGHVVRREDGNSYVEVEDVIFRFDTSRLYIELENLFNGDRAVADNMVVFLNENWREVLDGLKPGIEAALSAVFKEINVRLFSKVPYSTMHETN